MLHNIKQYIGFLANSTNQHGVHSPFVYSLVTKCFYNKTKYSDYTKISQYKKKTQNKKNIKSEKILYRLIKYFNPQNILQFAPTPNNINNYVMQLAQPNTNITNLKFSKLDTLETNKTFDFIFLDLNTILLKNNNLTSTFNILINKHTHNNSILVCKPNFKIKETNTIWSSLKTHPKITVTINVYFFKIIFFRKEQCKEKFTIRI